MKPKKQEPVFEESPHSSGQQVGAADFRTTHWSIVLAAADVHSPLAEGGLAQLCQTYRYPIYAFIRRRGYEPERHKSFPATRYSHA